ncbi:hypothetical protein Acr_00g0036840 [Actinidia rufa]|uniref:Reverse transcriptase/retrotransposon-derived protein RNase H-like domain-containing protein n=1 Tax=Actinidia rufa TaxID=165716 RepID=A0A7J0DGP1_9ERIC|nr:hypothetical protein Acr_00g0036840 [Actinidia rufa]
MTIKAQVLADFIAEFTYDIIPDPERILPKVKTLKKPIQKDDLARWKLSVDGSSNQYGCGAVLVLQTPSVQRDYLAKDIRMVAYLDKVKTISTKIKDFKICQIPRKENRKANLASAFDFTSDRSILLEFLPNLSIEVSKTICQAAAHPTWMDNNVACLTDGKLPLDKL